MEAALRSAVEFEALYVDAAAVLTGALDELIGRASGAGVRVIGLAAGVLEKIADTRTPQPVLAAVRFRVVDVTALRVEGLVLVLHNIRDPGNAGTIIRSADAAGVSAVVFSGQSVDPFNPKTVRATTGSIFHLPVAVASLESALAHFEAGGATTWATVVRGATDVRDVDFRAPTVVVIGNEADGLDDAAIARCGGAISIAMAGKSESLNAGVAASLVAFAALWQRQGAVDIASRPSLEGL